MTQGRYQELRTLDPVELLRSQYLQILKANPVYSFFLWKKVLKEDLIKDRAQSRNRTGTVITERF